MTVSRQGQHFFIQMQGQPQVEIFSQGPRDFFANDVDAQISFEPDAQGKTPGLVLHQNGRDIRAPRMDEAEAHKVLDPINARIKNNLPMPGSERALRRCLQELAKGNPDYDRLSPGFAELVREKLPNTLQTLRPLGQLVSLKFTGVDTRGWDNYKAKFEHGSNEWGILLGPDGKIDGEWFTIP